MAYATGCWPLLYATENHSTWWQYGDNESPNQAPRFRIRRITKEWQLFGVSQKPVTPSDSKQRTRCEGLQVFRCAQVFSSGPRIWGKYQPRKPILYLLNRSTTLMPVNLSRTCLERLYLRQETVTRRCAQGLLYLNDLDVSWGTGNHFNLNRHAPIPRYTW